MKHLAAHAEDLCRRLAPDAAAGAFYAVLRPDLPPEYQGGDDGPLAATTRHLDLILRPTLEHQRRWHGRGPAILLDPAAIAASLARRPRSARRRTFPVVATAVVLHELAHIIAAGPRDDAAPEPGLIEFGRLVLAADLTGTVPPTSGPDAAVPWFGHEWPFIRLTMHLAYRAEALGYGLAATDIFDAAAHGLSFSRLYMAALGDEPQRLADRPITTIGRVPPPQAFADLWQADVQAC